MVQFDDETTERWASDSNVLAASISHCEIVADPLYAGDPRSRAWSSPIRVAKERGLSLLADDAALRAAAREEGVDAFGSAQLLSAIDATNPLTGQELDDANKRLMKVRAAELPILDRILEIARDEQWDPVGYAGFLFTRPGTWIPFINGVETYMSVIRALPEPELEDVAGWCSQAIFGLCLTRSPQELSVIVGTLIGWTTLNMGADVLPFLLASAEDLVARFDPNANVLKEVVANLTDTMSKAAPAELLPGSVLPLLAGLNEETHRRAVGYFITLPWKLTQGRR
jgi:hypothetical protein